MTTEKCTRLPLYSLLDKSLNVTIPAKKINKNQTLAVKVLLQKKASTAELGHRTYSVGTTDHQWLVS